MNSEPMKTCAGPLCGGQQKPLGEFRDGQARCRDCERHAAAQRRATRTPEQLEQERERRRRYRTRNSEKIREQRQSGRTPNAEINRAREQVRKWLVKLSEIDAETEAAERDWQNTAENMRDIFKHEHARRVRALQERRAEILTLIELKRVKFGVTPESAALTAEEIERRENRTEPYAAVAAAAMRGRLERLRAETPEERERRHAGLLAVFAGLQASLSDPRFAAANDEAHGIAHRDGQKAEKQAARLGRNSEAAYSAAYEAAWQGTYRDPADKPLFRYRPEDIEAARAILAPIIEAERRELAAADLLGNLEE